MICDISSGVTAEASRSRSSSSPGPLCPESSGMVLSRKSAATTWDRCRKVAEMPFENEAGQALEIYGFHKARSRGLGCRLSSRAADPRFKQRCEDFRAVGTADQNDAVAFAFPVICGCVQNAVRAAAWDIRCKLPGLAGSQRSLKVWPRRGGGTCQGVECCNVVMNAPPFGGVTSSVTLTSQ